MSKYGGYYRTAQGLFNTLAGEKPHSSITDWIEVLSSDRYDEGSLDGIPELVESVNLQGHVGTTEAARAIRKKLKYGNVHRQIRALVILRALTENASKGFQVNWANAELMERLKLMAQDSLLDPKVKKRLIMVFHAWSIQYADEPRMREVANLYRDFQHGGRPTAPASARSSFQGQRSSQDILRPEPTKSHSRGLSDTDALYQHSWEPSQRGKDTYADLAAARADADERKREREERLALERREADLERRERELNRKRDMEQIEARRRREAEEEAERRRIAKEERKKAKYAPARPKFNFEKEKPAVMASVAKALQAASNLVNACRLIDRETENITENPRVQDNLDKAKAARRTVIRYIQLVTDEEYVGTLLEANEKIVEAIQLYDKLSKPAALDSDSDNEAPKPGAGVPTEEAQQIERIRQKLAAQKLESQRTGEVAQLQEAQKLESQRQQARQARRQASSGGNTFDDLAELDFSSTSKNTALPPPMRPERRDSESGSYAGGSLSDFSDYDSSEDEWRASHSRKPSAKASYGDDYSYGGGGGSGRHDPAAYASLDDEGSKGLLDDPFGDPFADDADVPTPRHEKKRLSWGEV